MRKANSEPHLPPDDRALGAEQAQSLSLTGTPNRRVPHRRL
jgi:hypothetical protein